MNYGALESEITDYLNAQFLANELAEKYQARSQPDNEAEFNKAFIKARVTVQYSGSTYTSPKTNNVITQLEVITLRLSFEARTMRGPGGFYLLLDHVKTLLIGYRPTNCQPLHISKYDLMEAESNSFQPYIEFQCETLLMQIYDPEPLPGAPFQQVLLSEV